MTTRRHAGALAPIALAILLALGSLAPSSVSADDPNRSQPLPPVLETLDDPPGVPARPVPGAPPAAQYRVGPFTSVQVNVDAQGANIPGDAANEPSIAVDPTNPNRLAIGWRQFDTVSSNFRQAGYGYSRDGGRTWTFPGVLTPGVFRSDPVLSFDSGGNFYYNSLESNFTTDVFKSTDQGQTWGPPVYAYGGDKQWMNIDRTQGIGAGNIYTAWSDFAGCCGSDVFNRSLDGGASFTVPVTIPQRPHWGTIDVSPLGAVFVAGLDSGLSGFYVAKSTNAQNPSGTPTFTATPVNFGGTFRYFEGPNPGGLLSQVWVAADPSRMGHVYALCCVNPAGTDPLDVHFVRSTDGGMTWSTGVRINDDAPASGSWQWFGTMSVAPNGRIDAVWNDTRSTGTVNLCQLYYSFSTDGGSTWSANEALSPVWDSFVGWPDQNKIGDYYHMISDKVGAHLAWAATLNGEQDVYYLRIGEYDCNDNGVPDSEDIAGGGSSDVNANGIPDECEEGAVDVRDVAMSGSGLRAIPNPAGPVTRIEFEVGADDARVSVQIFDVEGRLVRTLLDGPLGSGRHSITWDGTDDAGATVAPGAYFCRLERPEGTETRRILRLK